MNRRTFLAAAAATGGLLAGCLDDGTDDGPGAGGDTPTETGTPTPTDGTTETGTDTGTPTDAGSDGPANGGTPTADGPRVSDRSFEALRTECGQGADEATVTFGERRVDVAGTISGSNTCYTAELDSATYDESEDTLTVAVRAYVPESDGTQACGQCIVDIDYESTVEFEGGLPGEVVVTHDGERVTTRSR